MNTNPSPKLRFISDKKTVENHRALMQRPDLQQSIDFALLEYQGWLQRNTQEQMAGAGHLKMVGALQFISTLKNLGESMEEAPKAVDMDNLQHKV